ncbi:MAG TPA: hypothetical protein VFM29_01455 [Vicinamibacteria bacterium]|nr:hypothetical protein [Vicinamibacteria bacterium]
MRRPSPPIPLVRCYLDGRETDPARAVRYIPLGEFDLWKHLMESRHGRRIDVDEVSVWVPETPELWSSVSDADTLDPVLRIHFERPGPQGFPVPVERFLPAETYPQAQEALLSHFEARYRHVVATPGYFVAHAVERLEAV